jgi:hypothetical protein
MLHRMPSAEASEIISAVQHGDLTLACNLRSVITSSAAALHVEGSVWGASYEEEEKGDNDDDDEEEEAILSWQERIMSWQDRMAEGEEVEEGGGGGFGEETRAEGLRLSEELNAGYRERKDVMKQVTLV